jgi:predicted hotdog family 3-hydroxylacyl-ACP dehydratase
MDAETFVMHRAPMIFLDRLTDIGPDFAVCEWQVTDDFALFEPGKGVPAYAAIEYMAQCVAVHAGAKARARGYVPPQGYLLGTRHFEASIEYFTTGITYQAHCTELIRNADGLGSFACEVRAGGKTVASANLAVVVQARDIRIDD